MKRKKEVDSHPSQETRSFHPSDDLLRRNGYVLVERPKNGEPIWKRGQSKLPQSLALELCEKL